MIADFGGAGPTLAAGIPAFLPLVSRTRVLLCVRVPVAHRTIHWHHPTLRRALGLVAIAALALYLTISVELQMPRLPRALETVKLCIAQIGPFATEVCAVHP